MVIFQYFSFNFRFHDKPTEEPTTLFKCSCSLHLHCFKLVLLILCLISVSTSALSNRNGNIKGLQALRARGCWSSVARGGREVIRLCFAPRSWNGSLQEWDAPPPLATPRDHCLDFLFPDTSPWSAQCHLSLSYLHHLLLLQNGVLGRGQFCSNKSLNTG